MLKINQHFNQPFVKVESKQLLIRTLKKPNEGDEEAANFGVRVYVDVREVGVGWGGAGSVTEVKSGI